MIILYVYVAVASLFAIWMGWHMYSTLDRFDWDFRRSDIWLSFGLLTIFWPLVMIFKPSELMKPNFGYRTSMLNFDYAETTRQRVKFMENPPPCGSTVTYRTVGDDSKSASAVFYFSSASVETMAKEINQNHYKGLLGMNGAALWTSLRTESVTEPTEVPELLVNFDHIADGLIEAGHGQVRCLACNKTYTTTELTRESSFIGGRLLAHYSCPAKHWLLSHEIAHFMFKRNDDE